MSIQVNITGGNYRLIVNGEKTNKIVELKEGQYTLTKYITKQGVLNGFNLKERDYTGKLHKIVNGLSTISNPTDINITKVTSKNSKTSPIVDFSKDIKYCSGYTIEFTANVEGRVVNINLYKTKEEDNIFSDFM